MIKIYNSLTRKTEEFVSIKDKELTMYVCGPTVYDVMHIGNSRPIIFFDVVARFFKYLGYSVKFVSNFTDIDDKIIQKAQEEGVSETEISERYIKKILKTYQKLNCLPHYKNPQVTHVIPEIIDYIALLIEKKGAYVVNGDVYFDVGSVKDYGVLSGQTQDKLIAGARVEEKEIKRSPSDFNIWKETKTGLNWPSPWSEGRPGWHTECVVMINEIFAGKIDIHGGGSDLKFPHHDNEIAQSEVTHNHKIANYWLHNGRIDMQGEKMSKSIGNIILADDLVDEIGYGPYRLLILNVPYRQLINFTRILVDQAKTEYEKIERAFISLYRKLQLEYKETEFDINIESDDLLKINEEFIVSMSNDFNTANAITVIIKLVKIVNNLVRQKSPSLVRIKEVLSLLNNLLSVLGIEVAYNPLTEGEVELVYKWEAARKDKDFSLADQLRDELYQKGIIL